MTQNLPTMVYSAPEMAVLQTTRQFIDGAGIRMNWLVEPGLVRYFSPYEPRPIFTVRLQQKTIYTIEDINNIIGKETSDEFENRITKVVSKLKFPRKASTVLIAEDCVINAIVQKFIRSGNKLTTKQVLLLLFHQNDSQECKNADCAGMKPSLGYSRSERYIELSYPFPS
ncbi:hypothetical protein WUBG_10295 [Wuchereria bancrofti]|uniref:Uncharacterized protein n=1 Tax=Wuchereria bancrofti TaxID=6293 RepID=J9EP26_WUCBA|nr:hypothetical protein WUBG_10295 [Wuchereria bancrofti]